MQEKMLIVLTRYFKEYNTNQYGKYIIHFAIIYNGVSILKYLLENKVDVNVKDSENRSIMDYVRDHPEMSAMIQEISDDDLSDIVSFDTQESSEKVIIILMQDT